MTDTVQTAVLEWDADGQPLSSLFGDVYFSKANGLEETRHVFLHHNQLPERFSSLQKTEHFTVAETGFGSGLNFLASWELWLKTAPQSAQLHFVSVEKFPLNKPDLIRALALWPELKELSDQLIACYPIFVGIGFHRLKFMNGRINLTLIIDDAATGFTKLLVSTHPLFIRSGIKVNAWFLDGFAPAKNPHMWSDELFSSVKNLSCIGTTVSTFSAAAIVKNGLKKAGFEVCKVAGFGRKREMVKGLFTSEPIAPNPEGFSYKGSFSPYPVPWTINANQPVFTEKRAIIIGGGLAGCHSARALAERGWHVKILEQHAALAQEGSGNPQGVLYAKLSPMDATQAEFNLASLQYAINFYFPLWKIIGDQCGVLQLANKASEIELHSQLQQKFMNAHQLVQFVNPEQASALAGVNLKHNGLFFPQAGWIDPRKLCAYLTDHPNIEVDYHFRVKELILSDNNWQLKSHKDEIQSATTVIIASAKEAVDFQQANHLPTKSIRGQITYFPETKTYLPLKTVVCAEGYISPAKNGIFCTGASFNLNNNEPGLRAGDHQTNLANLKDCIPQFEMPENPNSLEGRVAFRCSLPDYLPCVGSLPQVAKFDQNFAPLRKNARAGVTTAGDYWPGLYINIGHGARGLAYTPLCAELLAAQINDEPIPLARDLINALNPARFIIRDLTRNKR